uniref:DUF1499 domain-containing protein n=1 Tax=Eucampia antarctica TaxID=49252 RepID=A0A7S2RCN3_9STRA|mmetsp:Transcript_20395/g.19610  ORF Transcript_20395/g.19610 Transcript_20395/m.19610 type:complete len:145 (+) Transcript_20395:2-436(+)
MAPRLGLIDGALLPPPSSPNCVCSQNTPEHDRTHYIKPLKCSTSSSVEELQEKIIQVIETNISNVKHADSHQSPSHYMRLIFTTKCCSFKDDVEFLFFPDDGFIHVRSASRVGHSDFGTNRKRIETIRSYWNDAHFDQKTDKHD